MAELLKELYNEAYITLLCKNIQNIYKDFEEEKFTGAVFNAQWRQKELKQRMRHISTTLGLYLPKKYQYAITILRESFNNMNYAYRLQNIIFQDFVEVYGMEDFETSMQALEIFTIKCSSEFAIRRFILKYEEKTMEQMLAWAKSNNEHLRRLSSEGCRSRLPWAIALPLFKKNPTSVLLILEMLKDDESEYVRKSVANNLNDISKDNPEIIRKITNSWIGYSKHRDALLKHGCRTLLKASDSETLQFFGFEPAKHISIENFLHSKNVKMGDSLKFSFDVAGSKKLGKLRVEFALHFLRKNGQLNKKVFKISEAYYQDKNKTFTKSYSFKPISTRVYYTGLQKLSIIINGLVVKETTFMLDEKKEKI